MTTKEIKKMKNNSILYIKYIDNENQASDSLYAVKKNDNRWQVGSAILSNKQIVYIWSKIENTINNNWRREGFQYWTNK